MISSVGSEHYLDKVGVTGSNPVSPTKYLENPTGIKLVGFFNFQKGSKGLKKGVLNLKKSVSDFRKG